MRFAAAMKIMPLARIRIPTGWLVEFNTLTEPIGTDALPPLDDLKEDQLLLINKHRGIIIDLSWLPEFNPHGRFVLTAAKHEEDIQAAADAWHTPLRIWESRSFPEIVAVLEDWLEDDSLRRK
jgi:hypothetical protein